MSPAVFDPNPFLSTVVQVGASFVAFLGGFFVMRLQSYTQDWRDLRAAIVEAERSEVAARLRAEAEEAAGGVQGGKLWVVHERAFTKLPPLWSQRDMTRFPMEIVIQFAALAALTYFGVWVPLMAMEPIEQPGKVGILLPVVLIVILLWILTLLIAVSSWRRLRREDPVT